MLDLKGYKGFALTKNDSSPEAMAVILVCTLQKIPILYVTKNRPYSNEFVPCGSVKWCESILGYHVQPNYYPDFLIRYLYRGVSLSFDWPRYRRMFVKPADRYKRFTGRISIQGSFKGKKKPPYWISEVVKFENEWRYYISNGKVLCGEWYSGDEINTPNAPNIDHIKFPNNFCGAVDFGSIYVGGDIPYVFALVENQHPFACGWYGKKNELYCQWLIDGWRYILGFYDALSK